MPLKDYLVSPTACSCPSARYRPATACKHVRELVRALSTVKAAMDGWGRYGGAVDLEYWLTLKFKTGDSECD